MDTPERHASWRRSWTSSACYSTPSQKSSNADFDILPALAMGTRAPLDDLAALSGHAVLRRALRHTNSGAECDGLGLFDASLGEASLIR
mmetsp:Transcript_73936/g.191984  ORF Transcript_73936/g.191984 Transcript_73936/m.191984 type:complete len:89 (+) Transcript_73936:735-1001(+)